MDTKVNLLHKFECNLYECACNNLLPYQCKLCNFQTHLKVGLFDHDYTIHKEQPLKIDVKSICKSRKCRKCNFQSFSVMVRTHHAVHKCRGKVMKQLKGVILKCPHCPYETKVKNRLRWHNIWKHLDPADIKWYECEHCPFKTKGSTSLKAHILAKHTPEEEINWYQCDKCNYKTSLRRSLELHTINIHSDPETCDKLFKCGHCPHKTARRGNLRLHIMRKHPECVNSSKCEHSTMSEAELKMSNKKRRLLTCKLCPYSTPRNANYKRHMMGKHPDMAPVDGFICEHCAFRTKESAILKKHIMAKHTDPSEKRWFFCEYCSYKTTTKASVRGHSMTKHPDKVVSFRCQGCYYRAKSEDILMKHIAEKHPDGFKNHRKPRKRL